MRYLVLAVDYDGTIANNGTVGPPVVAALEKLVASGRRLVLVTGRELEDLAGVYDRLDLFDIVVAENGALLHVPASGTTHRLAEPPPAAFVDELHRRGVAPISVGQCIVATREPHSQTVLQTIQDLGLELQVIFNKGAVMVLPPGVNKASGLDAALAELAISPRSVAGVGDAENDHSFLRQCELSAAVANALRSVKDAVDVVTRADHGDGVIELIEGLLENDLDGCRRPLPGRWLSFGADADGEVGLDPYDGCTLICGASASGKSTAARRIVDSLHEHGYQFCVVDPEGDYEELPGAVVIGSPNAPPQLDDVTQLLEDFLVSGVVCLTGVTVSDRPQKFVELLTELLQMRTRYGRPHWLVFDEAHHLMPAAWELPKSLLPEKLVNCVLVTVHADLLSPDMLRRVDRVVAVGETAPGVLERFAEIRGIDIPVCAPPRQVGEALVWTEGCDRVRRVQVHRPVAEQQRHTRKYAEGRLPAERSFYFRGADERMNLRAHNLIRFLELGEGVDDDTWDYHLRQGDYSKWLRGSIKDPDLAAEVEGIERGSLGRWDSLAAVRAAIMQRYTLPADPPVRPAGAS